MIKNILFTIVLFVYSCFLNAQVLYNENFDNYPLGDFTTDPTGVTPGLGYRFFYRI